MIRKIFSVLAILWMALIALLSLIPSNRLPRISWNLLEPDKVAHFVIYAVMTILLLIAHYRPFEQHNKAGILSVWGLNVAFIAATYGIIIEILQGTLTLNRHFDSADIVANCLGCIIGLLLFHALLKKFFYKTN